MKASHSYRKMANRSRESAARWLKLLKEYPDVSDSARMAAARQYRTAMADARKYDEQAREYQERGR